MKTIHDLKHDTPIKDTKAVVDKTASLVQDLTKTVDRFQDTVDRMTAHDKKKSNGYKDFRVSLGMMIAAIITIVWMWQAGLL